ncbi:hypothetical protein QBC36DRAFT_208510 [Triangularia setosa]|uniref:Tetraspanin n=1 Tax=Triangularia setosa TaxID=2587417 RepID=A0AAN7A984_9PEZI|nr:hypothetical protein QBC36DRAFT_208510 [Podospora setosa]
MALMLALYVLLIISLTGLVIYEHHTSTSLSLPLSPVLTAFTILLPLFSLLSTSLTSFPPRNRTPLLPILSNLFQLLLTIILSTLYGSSLTSPFTPCALQTTWQQFWTSHDATSIRKIQDSLSCCGFKSTKDMAWPFPSGGSNGDVGSCEKQFGRHIPCAGVWEGQLNKTAGVELGVVILVGVVQILSLVAFRGQRRGRAGKNNKGEWLGRVVEIFTGPRGGGDDEQGARRPLLTGGRRSDRYIAAARDGHGGVEQEGGHHEDDSEDEHANGDMDRAAGYGGTTRSAQTETQTNGDDSRGPRVEVSHHDPWAGAERV